MGPKVGDFLIGQAIEKAAKKTDAAELADIIDAILEILEEEATKRIKEIIEIEWNCFKAREDYRKAVNKPITARQKYQEDIKSHRRTPRFAECSLCKRIVDDYFILHERRGNFLSKVIMCQHCYEIELHSTPRPCEDGCPVCELVEQNEG